MRFGTGGRTLNAHNDPPPPFYQSSSLFINRIAGVARVLAARSPTGDKVTIINGSPLGGHVKYDVEVRDADHIAFGRPAAVFNGEPYRAHLLVSNGPRPERQTQQQHQLTTVNNVHARNVSRCSQQVDEQSAAAAALFKCTLRVSNADTGNGQQQQQLLGRIAVQPVFDRVVGAYACELRLLPPGSDDIGWSAGVPDAQLELEAVLGNGLAAARMQLQIVPAVQVVPRSLVAERLAEQLITVRGVDQVLQKMEVSCA